MFALGLPAIRVGWHVYSSPFGTGTGPWGLRRRPGKDTSLRVQALWWGGPVAILANRETPAPRTPTRPGCPWASSCKCFIREQEFDDRERPRAGASPREPLFSVELASWGQARTGSLFTPPPLRIQVGVSKASFPATQQLLRQSHPVCLSVHVRFLGI